MRFCIRIGCKIVPRHRGMHAPQAGVRGTRLHGERRKAGIAAIARQTAMRRVVVKAHSMRRHYGVPPIAVSDNPRDSSNGPMSGALP